MNAYTFTLQFLMTDRLPRKLVAVLYADIVGYSRMAKLDEDATHQNLKAALNQVSDLVDDYGGHVINYSGDAVLATFDAVVDALSCAAAIHRRVSRSDFQTGKGGKIQFRIGVNLGDVIEDGGDIFGDGVNIAARLEGLAIPGGICISESVHTVVGNQLPFVYQDMGAQSVKNIADPIHVYRVHIDPDTKIPQPQASPKRVSRTSPLRWRYFAIPIAVVTVVVAVAILWLAPLPDIDTDTDNQAELTQTEIPAIAVLPFDNMSGDPEQEYFSDGISEQIITDLSRLSNLAVIARNSSFSYKGTAVETRVIGESLGVRYILDGSVQRSGDRVRISAQLVDASNGYQVWAERYDRYLTDIFDLQDEITSNIVSELSVKLTGRESLQLKVRPTKSFDAYDLFLQGQRFYHELTTESLKQAEKLYGQAIDLDPEFSRAYGALGVTLGRQFQIDFSVNGNEGGFKQARLLVDKAVSIDPQSPYAHWASGFVSLMERNFEPAARAVEKAVELSPNYADAWLLLAGINNNLGRGDQALRFVRKARSLNPISSWNYSFNEGRAHYFMHNFEQAVEHLSEALNRNENAMFPRVYLTASYAGLGNLDEADWQVSQLEIMYPGITLSGLKKQSPISKGAHMEQLFSDLETAGIPE